MKNAILILLSLALGFTASAQLGVRITLVDTDYQMVELTNFGVGNENTASWYLCNFPSYMQISDSPAIIGNTLLGPGESVLIHWSAIGTSDGEIGLYLAPLYTNPTAMVDYFQWGSNNHQREMVAVGALLWPDDDFLPLGSPYTFVGPDDQIGEVVWQNTVIGCTYANATNYAEDATVDSGECVFPEPTGCEGDLTGDSIVDTSDLIAFLAAFGSNCL